MRSHDGEQADLGNCPYVNITTMILCTTIVCITYTTDIIISFVQSHKICSGAQDDVFCSGMRGLNVIGLVFCPTEIHHVHAVLDNKV